MIGGGAAGMVAAGHAAARGARVTVVERNARTCRKVMITGKGRCNLTNACTVDEFLQNVVHNPRFLYSSLSAFPPFDAMAFFEALGVPLKTERGRRVFPASDKAADIVDALLRFARRGGAQVVAGRATELLIRDGRAAGALLEDGRRLKADAVIVATGGMSYPLTGSTGDGYALARQAGHTIKPPEASLVALETREDFVRDLMGLSLRNVTLTLRSANGQALDVSEPGELLFTHFGVSGPLVLAASALLDAATADGCALRIDLKPGLTNAQLDARLTRDFSEFSNRDLPNALRALLPASLIPVAIRLWGVDPAGKAHQVTRAQRLALGELLKAFPLTVRAKRPLEEAVVTRGGVAVGEVEPATMRSKKLPGLYFAGEILDCDARTGGYNLQIAWSTGRAAGIACAE